MVSLKSRVSGMASPSDLEVVVNGSFDSPDADLILAAAHLGEVVIQLYAGPSFGGAAECFGKPHGHLWRNTALAVEQVVKGLPRDSQHLSALGNGQAERLKAIVPDGEAGMRGVLHRHVSISSRW